MRFHRWTTLAAALLLFAVTTSGCDFMNGESGEPNAGLCASDADCVDGGVCDPGTKKCVECLLDAHCPVGKKCDGETHQCVGCLADADCAGDLVCDSAHHLCVECMDDADCGEGGACDETKNVCIECVDDSDCEYPAAECSFAACMDGVCVTGKVPDGLPCNDGDPCTAEDVCEDGACTGGLVVPGCEPTGCDGLPDGAPCDDGDPCTVDDLCLAGECLGGPLAPECANDDIDGDGFTPGQGDCNDEDATIHPGAPEVCGDALDNDCDGEIDEDCQEECFTSGCSGEICSTEPMESDCAWLPEYECLKFSVCGNFGPGGGCAWLQTAEYLDCMAGMCLPEEICGNGLDDDCDGLVDNGCMMGCEMDSDCPLGQICEIYCGNGWCEGVCMPDEPENLCEQEGGQCFPMFWDDTGEWGICPEGFAEVDLSGCADDEICCLVSTPPVCESDMDCNDGDQCTFDYCINGMCVNEPDPDCGQDWCWSDDMCGWGQFCYLQGCAAETGTCMTPPESCPEYYSPVCACNGQTYGNICFLQAAGQSLNYQGDCDEPPQDLDGDGWTIWDGDCDDQNPTVNPGMAEDCDTYYDDNCNGEVNEGCGEPNVCEMAGGFCSGVSEDGIVFCPDGSAEVDLGGCGPWGVCCMPFEPPECGGPCECYDLYGQNFSDECPLLCPNCGNYWACEAGSCVEYCGVIPDEALECIWPCGEEICGDGIDNDCDGEVDEDCGAPCGGFIGMACPADQFCLYPDGTCQWADGMGTCQDIPENCYWLWDPVCGCDGDTYSNECLMWMAGVSKDHDGECGQECIPEGGSGAVVPDALKCCDGLTPISCDSPSSDGECMGCDGAFYCTYCGDGVCKDPENECNCPEDCGGGGQYCWSDDMCGAGEFCLFEPCEIETGICTEIPQICPPLWDPICGCDGETYPNLCVAYVAGTGMAFEGECVQDQCASVADCPIPDDPCVKVYCVNGECVYEEDPNCGGYCWGNDMCANGQFCLFDGCAAETGTCTDIPGACPYLWDPVCGCDGETYANECIAWVNGVSVDHEGECASGECQALDPGGYGACAMILGYAWDGGDCTLFSGCGCGQDCGQFFSTWALCMDACAPKPTECTEIDPYGYGPCEMLMGVGFNGQACVYVSGCGCSDTDPTQPSCDGLFETMDDCKSACI